MKIEKFLDRYFYKEDIQDLLRQLDLPVSGKKRELIKRLRKETTVDVFQLIGYLSKDQLKEACYDLDLKVGGTKDELRERVFDEIVKDWKDDYFVSEMKKAKENASISKKEYQDIVGPLVPKPKRERKVTAKEIREEKITQDFSSLVSAIEGWIPHKRHRNEEGYQIDLRDFLEYKCGYKVRLEAGRDRADILVNDKIPIEIKKNPTQSEYDRLIGQLTRDHRAKGCAVAVICDVRRLEQFQDFRHNISKLFPESVVVISK